MRKPTIAGNWKMNLTRDLSVALARAIRDAVGDLSSVEVGIAPPFPYLGLVADVLQGTSIWVAGQTLHEEASGAFTGEVSATMIRDVGASHVIIGHSERRRGLGESPELIGHKLQAALSAQLKPILCVGETLDEREGGKMKDVLLGQLDAAFSGCTASDLEHLIIAYEPVWAIGTGVNASPEQAGEAHEIVRTWLADRFTPTFAQSIRIQYGGSVKPGNAAELLAVEHVDGALVGGASLKEESFVGIIRAVAG